MIITTSEQYVERERRSTIYIETQTPYENRAVITLTKKDITLEECRLGGIPLVVCYKEGRCVIDEPKLKWRFTVYFTDDDLIMIRYDAPDRHIHIVSDGKKERIFIN